MVDTPPAMLFAARGSATEIETGAVFQPKFDEHGLIAAIVTDAASGAVLMFAWMNATALRLTLDTRTAHFWSRSRRKLWLKGEESGNVLDIVDIRTDCDQDALLVRATLRGAGVACHTGAKTCFYRSLVPQAGGQVMLQRTRE
jgi:phosphoribosyl-AMP cyclohydrolase